jgi:predicted MFS family arabinose efflux permease
MRSRRQPNHATTETAAGSRDGFTDGSVPAPRSHAAWMRLAACTGAAALLQLDGTLITVALPSVAHSMEHQQRVDVRRAERLFRRLRGGAAARRNACRPLRARRLALLGLGVFALGAAAGASSSSIGALAATRVVQGASAGLVSPAALAGAVSGFPPERRGRALGVWGASAGVSNLLGPLLGGLLTIALGWRADWWALVPLALLAASAIIAHVPPVLHDQPAESRGSAVNAVVLAAAFVAALTFAVMIGSFYIAEQYLQRAAGYSPLAASSVLVLAALLVGAAAPIAGRLADRRGERLPATAGFLASGAGLLVLGLPGVSLHSAVTIAPLIPVGLGLGMLFVPASRAALNATPSGAHGRTSAVLSDGRLLGAAVGAGLGGLALSGGATASSVHDALLLACGLCIVIGAPVCTLLLPAAGPPRLTPSARGEAGVT